MKIRILIAAVLIILAAGGAHAQRAVTFNGITALTNPGELDAPSYSISGVISYWYRATTLATATIIQSIAQPNTSLEVQHIRVQQSPMYLRVYLAGQNPDADNFTAISSQPLPYDGIWHHVSFTWDVSRPFAGNKFAFAVSVDGVINLIDTVLSQGTSSAFTIPYHVPGFSGNWWLIGARLTQSNTTNAYYLGDLAEVYGHFDSGDYAAIFDYRTMLSGFASKVYQFPSGTSAFGPLELGTACEAPFGMGASLPSFCLRGGPADFPHNYGGPSTFGVAGNLGQAATDPFSRWP